MKCSQQWQWPLCKQPKTLSFREGDDIFKTVNSVFFDPCDDIKTPETWFANSSESASISISMDPHGLLTESDEFFVKDEALESIIKGVQSSKRLFFDPEETNAIFEEAKVEEYVLPFKESVVLVMESDNPYQDFKNSMQEMIEINGLKDWECLEEMLGWYLKMNGKGHHGFIIEAFIDMLIEFLVTLSIESDSIVSAESSCSSSSPLFSASQTQRQENSK